MYRCMRWLNSVGNNYELGVQWILQFSQISVKRHHTILWNLHYRPCHLQDFFELNWEQTTIHVHSEVTITSMFCLTKI